MFYRNVSDALKTIVNDIDPKINFKSWDSEIHNIGEDEEYPMFILAPMVNVMDTTGDELTDAYSISWFVIESLNTESDQDQVMVELNNMSELSKQIFLTFENTYGYNTKVINGERMDFNVIDPYTAQTVIMEKGDNRTGIAAQFTIENRDNDELCGCDSVGLDDCEPVTVRDSDGVTIVSVASGGVFACDLFVDATYENSDQTFQQAIANGATFVAPDVSHVDSDGTPTPTPANSVFTCTAGITPTGIAYQRPNLTGQDVSYSLNDDGGQVQSGQRSYTPPTNPTHIAQLDDQATNPFITLKINNTFGNLFRFTGLTGGYQDIALSYFDKDGVGTSEALAFPDDIVVCNYSGLAYTRKIQDVGVANWDAGLTSATASTVGGETDWFLGDMEVCNNIECWDSSILSTAGAALSYPPFNLDFSDYSAIWTSTTKLNVSTTALFYGIGEFNDTGKTNSTAETLFYRNHFN